jgi:phosphatidylserine/phosphatidylglycerophosphate/cardiolipin synthase-like enzyme
MAGPFRTIPTVLFLDYPPSKKPAIISSVEAPSSGSPDCLPDKESTVRSHPFLFPRLVALSFLVVTLSSCATTEPKIDICFSPGGCCLDAIVTEIANAQADLRIQASSLNAKAIRDAVGKAKNSGVNVRIILDGRSRAAQNSAQYFSALYGIRTWLDSKHALADANVIIIDKATVITGSFNFTNEAEEQNAENLMIIRSERVAGTYVENWNLHRSHAVEFRQADARSLQDEKSEKKVRKKKKKTGSR